MAKRTIVKPEEVKTEAKTVEGDKPKAGYSRITAIREGDSVTVTQSLLGIPVGDKYTRLNSRASVTRICNTDADVRQLIEDTGHVMLDCARAEVKHHEDLSEALRDVDSSADVADAIVRYVNGKVGK